MLVRTRSLEKGMSHYLIEKIGALPNVEVMTGTELTEVRGDGCRDAISISRHVEPRRRAFGPTQSSSLSERSRTPTGLMAPSLATNVASYSPAESLPPAR